MYKYTVITRAEFLLLGCTEVGQEVRGSTLMSAEIITTYRASDGRTVIHIQENGGESYLLQ